MSKSAEKPFTVTRSPFMNMLTYRGEESGIVIHEADPAYASQQCSEYGTMVPKYLSVRVHNCKSELDRDIKTAKNILNAARGRPGMSATNDNQRASRM